uniref:hypothetical protein n=1 Tax=Herbidospora sakaeratensis TaxID=564415 RepID=UPI000784C6F3|nr:hypothetical protein [Herbidospora sakaeratensis]
MARITIGDQVAEVNLGRLPLHQGIALQKATKMRSNELGTAMQQGDLEAVAALAWLVLKFYMGHDDLTFDDVVEGRFVINMDAIKVEDAEAAEEDKVESSPTPAAVEAAPI